MIYYEFLQNLLIERCYHIVCYLTCIQ